MFIQTGIWVSEEIPSFDPPTTTLPAAMHLRIQYLGAVALIEASKQKELDTIESSVERLRMKQDQREWTELREVRTRALGRLTSQSR